MALRLEAPAKVNLFLRVLGKRPDGYHELETLFHAIDLADVLFAERVDEPGIALEVVGGAGTGLPVALGADNLVARAARGYVAATGVGGGFRFRLEKRIPAGGGLGGGSSDAAAALRLVDALCGGRVGIAGLERLAATLGADVPFFLRGGTQVGRGVGTQLTPCTCPPLHFVLLLPEFGTETVRVYENYRPQLNDDAAVSTIRSIEARLSQGTSLAAMLRNDLESAAASAYPALERMVRRIGEAGYPGVRLSGSGSTLYLAFDDRGEAERAAVALAPVAASESLTVVQAASARGSDCVEAPWPGGEAGH